MTNKELNNYFLTPILGVIFGVIFYCFFCEVKDIYKFNAADKNELHKINKIKIEKAATVSIINPIQKIYDLVYQNIIEKDQTINKLTNEISILKEQILEAIEKGEDVSAQINLLNQKETELNEYLLEKSKQNQSLKDTIHTYPEKLKKYQLDFERKKNVRDSLNNILTDLNKKCN